MIHGTRRDAYLGSMPGVGDIRWTDPARDDSFARRLADRLDTRLPMRVSAVVPFEWCGTNGHGARHRASLALARWLDAAATHADVHLVGHSHGGNVALHGAGLASHKPVSITTVGVPMIGATLHDRTRDTMHLVPVYLPTPAELDGVRLNLVHSPDDTVCRDDAPAWSSFARVRTGDAPTSQLEAWRLHHGIGADIDDVAAPASPTDDSTPNAPAWSWQFTGRQHILPQRLDPEQWPQSQSVAIPAQFTPGKLWVHSALHCREMGTAVADMIAGDPATDAVARHGLERFEWPTNRGE